MPHREDKRRLRAERRDGLPRMEPTEIVRRHIENASSQRRYGYFAAYRVSRGHEFQFELLCFRALADQPLIRLDNEKRGGTCHACAVFPKE